MDYSSLFVGLDTSVPLLDGRTCRYINLDNAASTPSFAAVAEAVQAFLAYYSSVHRGTGFKSLVSTHAYEQGRADVLQFVGADPVQDVCIFGKNTTEAINKLARRFPFTEGRRVVLVSGMEHHSNDLPWRAAAQVVHIAVMPDGQLDEADLDAKLARYAGQVALVAVTGASNVTGWLNPVYRLAEKAHAAGAQILVDCAQLAPHRRVDMRPHGDPAHLDYVTVSAHKLYAPFGSGALIGARETFAQGEPDMPGGGEVEIVTRNAVAWSAPPDRDEAGSPNTVGVVAFSAAIQQLNALGMSAVAQHEVELTLYALQQLKSLPKVRVFGGNDPLTAESRLGVIPILVDDLPHSLVAAVLGYEFGIGVRNGCFCAHPYLLDLLGVQEEQAEQVRTQILQGDRREVPGLVRISFGLYNTRAEVDGLMAGLACVSARAWKGDYVQDCASGQFAPRNWDVKMEEWFSVGKFIRR